jgi:[ribosomal protein S5]-alanine N-acetyltransferase
MEKLMLPEKIRTERLIMQRLRYEDAEEIFYTYASKPEVTKYVSWPTHRTMEDTQNFLRYAISNWSLGLDFSYTLRQKNTTTLIGSFGLMNEDGKIQFGYALSPVYWSQGYATEACSAFMKLVNGYPQVFRVNTFVDTENIGSIRVLEKCGLVREATLRKWFRFVNQNMVARDCYLYVLPLDHEVTKY